MGLAGAGDDALQPGLEQHWRLSNDIEGADRGAVTWSNYRRLDAAPHGSVQAQPIFDPLRRWFPTANLAADDEIPLAATIEAMDAGGVCLGLVCVVGTSQPTDRQ